MNVFNLYDDELDPPREHPGYTWRAVRVGEALGAERIGASLYELPPGQKSFPYHYERGAEEWLICVSGRPTLRTPDGERELRPGDTVCFRDGPAGAHSVENKTEEPVRVLILSTKGFPAIAVYPDSDKIGVWVSGSDSALFPRSAAVDYWEGES